MSSTPESPSPPSAVLTLSAKLNHAETVEAAAARAVELGETAFEQSVVSVISCDPQSDTATVVASSTDDSDAALDGLPGSVVARLGEGDGELPGDDTPDATVDTDPPEPLSVEVFVPVGRVYVLALGTADSEGFDDADIAAIEGSRRTSKRRCPASTVSSRRPSTATIRVHCPVSRATPRVRSRTVAGRNGNSS